MGDILTSVVGWIRPRKTYKTNCQVYKMLPKHCPPLPLYCVQCAKTRCLYSARVQQAFKLEILTVTCSRIILRSCSTWPIQELHLWSFSMAEKFAEETWWQSVWQYGQFFFSTVSTSNGMWALSQELVHPHQIDNHLIYPRSWKLPWFRC